VPDVEDIGQLVVAQLVHQPSQQPMSWQRGRAIGDQGQRRSLVTVGQILDLRGDFVCCRFRRKIDPGRQHDPTGADEHGDDRLLGVEAHQVRDDSQ
jgi:hypothetical protein